MSNEERQNTSIGKIINLISIDMQNILKIPSLLVIMTSCPLEILLYIYVLYQYVGVASFGGLFVLILVIPFSTSASLMLRKLQGANLSGGQKQRVSLARSVYHDADIYLLDDPLNAVDAHVGKYLFETVIGRTGLLKHKTRIFVTNNVNHLSQCDSIIVMSKGKIVQHTSFSKMIEMDSKVTNFCWPDNHTTQANGEFEKTTVYSSRKKTQDFNENCKEGPENHKFKRNVIVTYIRKMGINFAMLLAILYATAEILDTFKDMSLSHWSKQSSSENVSYWLYIKMFFMYAVIGILQGCAIFFSSYVLSYGALKASIELHKVLLNCIMRSPISFFHKTPIGQITQRFSKDISVLDTDFVASLNLWLILLSRLVSIFFIAIKMLPFMMIIILPMIWLFWLIQLFHYRSSRNFTILECNTKSSIDSFFSESVIGASSIRAYDLSQNFIESLHRKIDENTKSCYISAIAIRWVTMRLEILTNCVICLVAMFMIMNKEKFSAGEIGLAISNILALTTCLTTFVSETSFVQNNIVSIERLLDYCYLPSEASLKNDFDNIHTNWPTSGSITFSNYFTKYGNGLKTALNNINFKIKSREKIGICGRTGAGKSTLSLALLRLIEGSSGKIFIDGVDISQLGLQKLRSSITIIPQSQILFNGTLRENLDPFQDHDDDSLWAVLKHVHMMEFFRKQDSGLEFLIGEMGSNLSVGQCQLLCLARAMLKKSKILILDEATAGIDTETDNLIQETIRSEFDQCTVLVIAHRLNSIMDCSRVLVLDNGEIAEFDTVDNLLKSKKLFYELTVDAGIIK